jgi:hypothetical protein
LLCSALIFLKSGVSVQGMFLNLLCLNERSFQLFFFALMVHQTTTLMSCSGNLCSALGLFADQYPLLLFTWPFKPTRA